MSHTVPCHTRSPSHSPATLSHKSTTTAVVPIPAAGSGSGRRKPSPEQLYTSEMMNNSNNNNSAIGGGGRGSENSSVSGLNVESFRDEDQLTELHQAALVGKLLLDSNSKLRLEVEFLKREADAKDKEISWLKGNQESKREFYDEIDMSRQEIQVKYDELKIEQQKLERELAKNKQKLSFQEKRIIEVENQLNSEMVWNNWYNQDKNSAESNAKSSLNSSLNINSALSPSSQSFPQKFLQNDSLMSEITQQKSFPPSIAPIHQKMMMSSHIRRSASDPDLNNSSTTRNLSADFACSQSRLDAELEELTNSFFEDLSLKQKEIQQISIQLDEQKVLLARAEDDKNELENEKQALIAQIQKPNVREIEAEVDGNELYSVDAKTQQQKHEQMRYDLARKKFDKILSSLETEKQKIGTISGSSSNFTLSRSCSMRISSNKSSIMHQKLQRFNSTKVQVNLRSNSSSSLTQVTDSSSLELDYDTKPRAFTISTVPVIVESGIPDSRNPEYKNPEYQNSESTSTEPSSTPKSYSSVIDTNLNSTLQANDFVNIMQNNEDDQEELNFDYELEEPEYKKLFQELFDIIHSVIPEDQSCFKNEI